MKPNYSTLSFLCNIVMYMYNDILYRIYMQVGNIYFYVYNNGTRVKKHRISGII